MVEEVKVPNEGKEIPDGKPSWTPAEERAINDGWRPEDEWEGEPDDFVDAKAFNFRGELMARISQQGKKLSKVEADNATLSQMVRKANEITQKMTAAAVDKATRELKMEKIEAVRDGDAERVVELDDQLDDMKTAKAELITEQEAVQPEIVAPDFAKLTPQQRTWVDFVSTTPWAQEPQTHPQLMQFADSILLKDPNMSVGELVSELNEWGRRSKAQSRPTPAGPDASGANGRKKVTRKGKYSESDLDEMEASIAKEFVLDGTVESLDAYAELLGKDGNLAKQSRN